MKTEKIVKHVDKREKSGGYEINANLPMPENMKEAVSLFENGEAQLLALIQDRLRVWYRSKMEGAATRKEKPVKTPDGLRKEIMGDKAHGFIDYNPQGTEGDPAAKGQRKAQKLLKGMSADEIKAALAEFQAAAKK